MTKKRKCGTISTTASSDKKISELKERDVIKKTKALLGVRKVVFLAHANKRMGERSIIYYEVLQALSSGRHDPKRDRFSDQYNTWEYSIEGETNDGRELRIGISFEVIEKTKDRLLIITVIDLGKE